MHDYVETGNQLQETTLSRLHSVDLLTPAQQLREIMTVLVDLPTFVRQSDTDFTRQASAELALLTARTQQLSEAVRMLTRLVPAAASSPSGASCPPQSVGT